MDQFSETAAYDPFLDKYFIEEQQNYPENFGIPKVPYSWDYPHALQSYIDTPIHLLFLECVKLINKRILDWSAMSKKETQLVKTFSSLIPSIYDLKLEWCKTFPLSASDSFSGLVSENWLVVCRLSR